VLGFAITYTGPLLASPGGLSRNVATLTRHPNPPP
jgi:hypothetical protein